MSETKCTKTWKAATSLDSRQVCSTVPLGSCQFGGRPGACISNNRARAKLMLAKLKLKHIEAELELEMALRETERKRRLLHAVHEIELAELKLAIAKRRVKPKLKDEMIDVLADQLTGESVCLETSRSDVPCQTEQTKVQFLKVDESRSPEPPTVLHPPVISNQNPPSTCVVEQKYSESESSMVVSPHFNILILDSAIFHGFHKIDEQSGPVIRVMSNFKERKGRQRSLHANIPMSESLGSLQLMNDWRMHRKRSILLAVDDKDYVDKSRSHKQVSTRAKGILKKTMMKFRDLQTNQTEDRPPPKPPDGLLNDQTFCLVELSTFLQRLWRKSLLITERTFASAVEEHLQVKGEFAELLDISKTCCCLQGRLSADHNQHGNQNIYSVSVQLICLMSARSWTLQALTVSGLLNRVPYWRVVFQRFSRRFDISLEIRDISWRDKLEVVWLN